MRTIVLYVAILASGLLAISCGGNSEGADDDGNSSSTSGGSATQCEQGCDATLEAGCSLGPPDKASCVSDCKGFASGKCAGEYQMLQACGEGKSLTCSAQGIPTVPGCASEQNDFVTCLSQ